MDWFSSSLPLPQYLEGPLILIKGLCGLMALVMLAVHMVRRWASTLGRGQRARYWALLAAAFVLAVDSFEQSLVPDFQIKVSNILALLASFVLLWAARISIREGRWPPDGRRPPRNQGTTTTKPESG